MSQRELQKYSLIFDLLSLLAPIPAEADVVWAEPRCPRQRRPDAKDEPPATQCEVGRFVAQQAERTTMSKRTSTIAASALVLGLGGGMLAVSAPAAHAQGGSKMVFGASKSVCTAGLGAVVAAKAADPSVRKVYVSSKCRWNDWRAGYVGMATWRVK